MGREFFTILIKTDKIVISLIRKIDFKSNIIEVNNFANQKINFNQNLDDIFTGRIVQIK